MKNFNESAGRQPRVPLFLLVLAAALLVGAAFAGWLDHGPQIFLSMAADAWAYCF